MMLAAVIISSYLMIALDISIVITALPKIHYALGFRRPASHGCRTPTP